MTTLRTVAVPTALLAALAFPLAGCGSSGSSSSASPSPAETTASASATEPSPAATGKEWTVDTSGWWVPSDPNGCLNETTTCKMSVWETRAYENGKIILNLMTHGDTITLICKAPTPAPIRNSKKHESQYWYFSDYQGSTYWIPDIYVTNKDVTGMAKDVPDCPSSTPGVNG